MIQLVPANRNKSRARGGMTYAGQPGSAGGSGCSLAVDSDRLLPALMITWLWAGCDSVPTRRQTTRAGDDLSLAAVNRAAIAAKGWQRRSGRRPAPAAAPAEPAWPRSPPLAWASVAIAAVILLLRYVSCCQRWLRARRPGSALVSLPLLQNK
jgi:hypothetical protein